MTRNCLVVCVIAQAALIGAKTELAEKDSVEIGRIGLVVRRHLGSPAFSSALVTGNPEARRFAAACIGLSNPQHRRIVTATELTLDQKKDTEILEKLSVLKEPSLAKLLKDGPYEPVKARARRTVEEILTSKDHDDEETIGSTSNHLVVCNSIFVAAVVEQFAAKANLDDKILTAIRNRPLRDGTGYKLAISFGQSLGVKLENVEIPALKPGLV